MEVIDKVEKEPCNRCRHAQNKVCVYPASDFYLVQTTCDVVDVTNLETGETEVFRYEKEDMLNKVPFLSKYVFKACEWILKDSN